MKRTAARVVVDAVAIAIPDVGVDAAQLGIARRECYHGVAQSHKADGAEELDLHDGCGRSLHVITYARGAGCRL